jgi:hypothetical protein
VDAHAGPARSNCRSARTAGAISLWYPRSRSRSRRGRGKRSIGRCPVERYQAAGGQFLVCPICFNAKGLDEAQLIKSAEIGGTVPLWRWIGDGATTFSY